MARGSVSPGRLLFFEPHLSRQSNAPAARLLFLKPRPSMRRPTPTSLQFLQEFFHPDSSSVCNLTHIKSGYPSRTRLMLDELVLRLIPRPARAPPPSFDRKHFRLFHRLLCSNLLWRGIDDFPITPTVVARNRLYRSAIAINLPAAQIYRDLHHILLCSGLWRESGQIVESFGSFYAVPRISSGIHKDPTQHIRCSNDAQLCELSFGRARTYPACSLKFNSFNERIIIESGPSRFVKEMVFRADLLFRQHSLGKPRHAFHEALIFPKLHNVGNHSEPLESAAVVKFYHVTQVGVTLRQSKLPSAKKQGIPPVPPTIFDRLNKSRPAPIKKKIKVDPAQKLLDWLQQHWTNTESH